MTYLSALQFIHSLNRFGSKPGLSRILELLNLLGNPQNDVSCIHVAGTNGKGSTSTMISQGLIESGKKVGLYTSPFIIDFRERIQINNTYINKRSLARLVNKVKTVAATMKDHPTEFEFITAVMFLYFKEQKVDIAVIEVGLGGRFDATNVITPIASVITKISLDHTAVLGNTFKDIAYEKSGIIKNGVPTVVAPNQEKEALQEILRVAKEKQSEVTITTVDKEFELSLCGGYQQENATTAYNTLKLLDVEEKTILQGLKNAFIPARMEQIANDIYIDGAHNPDGAVALSKQINKNSVLIMGMMADKDTDFVIKILTKNAKMVITVTVLNQLRTEKADVLAQKASKYTKAVSAKNYTQALNLAKANSNGSDIVICGSLYLASEIREKAKKFFNSTT